MNHPRPSTQADHRRNTKTGHLSVDVLAFFASNPTEELSTRDICAKFGLPPGTLIRACLRALIRDGLVHGVQCGPLPGDPKAAGRPPTLYRAGSRLLSALGSGNLDDAQALLLAHAVAHRRGINSRHHQHLLVRRHVAAVASQPHF